MVLPHSVCDAILALAAKHGARNVRIFGSVAEGKAAMKDDKLYLIHIDECISRIESYTQGMTKEAFLASAIVHDYLGVDLEKVWAIGRNDLPILKHAADEILGPNKPTRPS